MATKVTSAPGWDSLEGSPDKRYVLAPDGTQWLLVVAPRRAVFFRSTDGGATMVPAADSDLDLRQYTAVPSFLIDESGYAWVSWGMWDCDPQVIRLARGKPTTGGGWSWTTLELRPGGRLGVDTDLVAFRSGTGWVAFVSWTSTAGIVVSQINLSTKGVLGVTNLRHGPAGGQIGGGLVQAGSMDFAHTGDGVTASAAPHVFLATFAGSGGTAVALHRARYEAAGTWTWEAPVTVETGLKLDNTALCGVWDGDRFMVVYCPTGATQVRMAEWTGSGAVTMRNPPAMPSGVGAVQGLSLGHDPVTDDLYVVAYDGTDGDVRFTKFTRSTLAWSAWAVAADRPPSQGDGKVNLVRHAQRDSINLAWATPGGAGWNIYVQQLAALVRAPAAPVPLDPPNGAQRDLAAGYTFRWRYVPVGPGDSQQSWCFRRTYSSTTEWWNAASQTWQAAQVYNASDPNAPERNPFTAGKWTTGTTYTWAVGTKSATGAASALSNPRTVVATAAPVVTVVEPSGLIYGTSTPRAVWQVAGADPQRDYQVRFVAVTANIDPNDPGPAAWDSGVTSSALARSALAGTALSDATAYRAYVRVTSSAGVSSSWAYSDFKLSLAPPAGPVVEVLDEMPGDREVPRVRLDLLARSNFLTGPQALGQSGWDALANSAVAAQADDSANQLVASMKLTSSGAGIVGARTSPGSPPLAPYGRPQPAGPLSFPVVPTLAYTAVASVKAAGTVRAARVSIEWYDADDGSGNLISTSVGDQVVTGTTSYVPGFVTARAPAAARLARVLVEVLGATAAAEVFYVAYTSFHPGTDAVWQPGGFSDLQTLRLERSDDGRMSWTTLQERIKPNLYQQATARDRTMPFGKDISYRVTTDVDLGSGSVISSALSPIASITLAAQTWAIRDLSEDTAEVRAFVTKHSRSDEERVSVHRPSGREYPVIDSEGPQSAEGSLELYIKAAEVQATTDLLRSGVPLLVQSPLGTVLLLRFPKRDYETEAAGARTITADYVEIEG